MADTAIDHIVTQAAAWLVRLDDAPDIADLTAWRHWHDADPRHAQVWRRFTLLRGTLPDGLQAQDEATAKALSLAMTTPSRRRALKLLACGFSAGLGTATAYREAQQAGWLAAYRSGIGQQRRLELPGEISLMLNTSTSLDLARREDGIDVRLYRGEIVLETHAARFIPHVMTPQGAITGGLGKLAVRLQDAQTRVAADQSEASIVTHGQVRARLPMGHALTFTRDRIAAPSTPVSLEFAWTHGVLIADDTRLDTLLAELARYRPGILGCDDDVAGRRVSGTFRIQETDRVLEALAAALGLRVIYRTRYWTRLEKA